MSAPPDLKHEGAIGALTELGGRLVGALPPAFLMLCCVNVVFLGVVLWFLDDQLDQRTKLVGDLLQHCLAK